MAAAFRSLRPFTFEDYNSIMKFKTDTNGKLTMVVEYSEAFELADMWPQDLQSAEDRANNILQNKYSSRGSRTLAKQTLKLILWIKREIWVNQQKPLTFKYDKHKPYFPGEDLSGKSDV